VTKVLHAILLEECGEGIQVERAGGMEWACGYDVSSEPRFPCAQLPSLGEKKKGRLSAAQSRSSLKDSVRD